MKQNPTEETASSASSSLVHQHLSHQDAQEVTYCSSYVLQLIQVEVTTKTTPEELCSCPKEHALLTKRPTLQTNQRWILYEQMGLHFCNEDVSYDDVQS